MRIGCTVKFIPDVNRFIYDFESNTVVRENVRMIVNPEDAKAVAFALEVKKKHPETLVEVLSMGPKSVMPLAEDLVRMGVDQVTLISDPVFMGSDSYVTSKVLGTYLKEASFDLILTGTHSMDGDTSHVPSQLAEFLDLPQLSNVVEVDLDHWALDTVEFTVDEEASTARYAMRLPGILSLGKDSGYKLPYIRYEDMNRDVRHWVRIVTNQELGLNPQEVGIRGSLTKVKRTFVKEYQKKAALVLQNDEAGVDAVYQFLKDRGYV